MQIKPLKCQYYLFKLSRVCSSKLIQCTVCLELCVSIVEICEFRNCIKLVTAGRESLRCRL